MLEYVQNILCAVCIIVFAIERFDAPLSDAKSAIVRYRTSRSTTTAASYYTAVSFYCAIALAVYAFLLFVPRAVDRLVTMAPEGLQGVPAWARESPSLLVALILTVLLPKIPVLSSMDEWFRSRLQYMAAIPHEVRRLSAQLRRVPFEAEPGRREELVESLIKRGFERADLILGEGSPPHALWVKLSLLMARLDAWEADVHFASYVLSYPNEFNALRLRYEQLVGKALKCFGLLRELASDAGRAPSGAAVYAYRDSFVEEAEGLLKDVYEATSHAVLLCQLTRRARARELIGMGFRVDPEPPRRLTLNELMGLFTGLTIVFVLGFVMISGGRGGRAHLEGALLVKSVMIAAIYCVAVWCAIYPKSRWSFACSAPETGRPWGSYLLSGLAAAATGALVSYGVKAAMLWDLDKAWVEYRQLAPWAFMTFATAYGVAFLADDELTTDARFAWAAAWLRWVEAIALTVVMAAAGWLVHGLLESTQETVTVPELGHIIVLTAAIGFAIGALVPSWYRSAPLESKLEARLRVAPGVGAGRA